MALVIFDYDGALADTLADLLRFAQIACDQLGVNHRVTPDDLSRLEVMSFAAYGRACAVPEPQVAEFVEICLSLFAQKNTPPALIPGMGAVIRQLSAKHALAIVTTNSSQNVNAFLASHGLKDCIRAVYGVDTPGSKAQKITLARGSRSPAATFMVGDSLSDILAAKEASVVGVAVAWGHQSLAHLLRGAPDHVVHTPGELLALLARLNAETEL